MSHQHPHAAMILAALVAMLPACAPVEEVDGVGDALAEAGPWHIPPETIAIGDTMHVDYTGAGPWVGTSGCGPADLTPGARVLKDFLQEHFPQISSIGGYSCRHINGDSSQMSVHATGRALDVMIPTAGGEADNDLGDPVGNWLIEHAEALGMQYIIWDRWTWGAHRSAGAKERSYGGAHPHHDHLHVELGLPGSRGDTPWFSSGMEPPSGGEPCQVLGRDGGELDDTGACFTAYGNSDYWRRVDGAGVGGSLIWTNAWESSRAGNWARWQVHLAEGGEYTVEVSAPPAYAVFEQTRYVVRHGGTDTEVIVDQSASEGWITLGDFRFAGGGGELVSVYDNSEDMVAPESHIAVDAIRLRRVDRSAPPTPTPGVVEVRVLPPAATVIEMEPGPTPELMNPEMEDEHVDDVDMRRGGESRAMKGGCSASGSSGAGALAAASLLFGLALRRRRA